ncbi:M20 metallopeptidase family protein [Marivirga arenosa]|uniref:M20 family metallopeptidase n=1 Tax=Marivirga arenosa TaxID=3059076 RepID=A0AA52EZ72_9BACT|nr:M20 family metallopeptidase [Marivirga sp. BKB1-2]WNB18232.1 M20 family metallopeptidase [Marivirga sp. BKB1-2]
MDLKSRIQSLAKSQFEEVKGLREHLHANPELSFEEFETAKFISKTLTDWGIDHQTGVADTGTVVLIKGKNSDSKVTALRADIDALPIKEQNEVPYKSKNEGVMHACGHDVHTSCMLGAVKILNELKDQFEGTIKVLFQPGEEKVPGGASKMIKEGVLKNPDVNNIIGQHVMPLIDAGKVGFRSGMYMASTDELYLTIKGKGGHGAMPEQNVDPVIISANILVALQQIVSRHASPKVPSVVSFGKVIAEGATNVIPNEVYIEGTFRTMDEEWRAEAHKRMRKMIEGMAESMGATADFEIRKGYPYLINEPELTDRAKANAIEYLGEENVEDLDLWMAAEDFAYFSQATDACFYRLGVRNEARGITSSVHTPTFDIDPVALETGMGLIAWLAIKELESK